jgi:hypothetical protein
LRREQIDDSEKSNQTDDDRPAHHARGIAVAVHVERIRC